MIVIALHGCTTSHVMSDSGVDGGPIPVDTGPRDAARDASRPPVICAGAECAPGEECCFLTGACFAPSVAGACSGGVDAGTSGCASNADCAPDEFCYADPEVCLGPGTCVPRTLHSCSAHDERCGCDGRTYDNACEAEQAGVRVIPADGPCGSTGGPGEPPHPPTCGRDDQCPGTRCCAITGLCLPADCPECCFLPDRPGWPCANDAYCQSFEQSGTGVFCDGTSCTGPGVCSNRGGGCDGTLEPVCGCDGTTYTNASCARYALVRIEHSGECID